MTKARQAKFKSIEYNLRNAPSSSDDPNDHPQHFSSILDIPRSIRTLTTSSFSLSTQGDEEGKKMEGRAVRRMGVVHIQPTFCRVHAKSHGAHRTLALHLMYDVHQLKASQGLC